MSSGAHSSVLGARRRRARTRVFGQAALASLALLLALTALVGAVFAGSPARLAEGVRIAGVDVGGMTPREARSLLERKADALRHVPVAFIVGEEKWEITPHRLGVEADFAAAVDAAHRHGEGFGPFRGLRRAKVQVFGLEISPPAKVYEPALAYQLEQLAAEIDQPHREAAIVLKGLEPVLVGAQSGRSLDADAAAPVMVGALAGLARAPTALPVELDSPTVTAVDLQPALRQARVALAAPIRLELGETWWRLRPVRIAELLALPRDGTRDVTVGGPGADAWFKRFGENVGRPATDARFRVMSGEIAIIPHQEGMQLNVRATRASLQKAILSPTNRVATASVVPKQPQLTSGQAKAMGVTSVLASYSTGYSGSADRIHNLQLAVSLLDGARVAPGAEFSLNQVVGERTLERGFRPAPVIIGGEYEEGVGGGVSQVATTVFNAAWEAGLKITSRAPHSLYIDRYPLGRDATVNYPDLDLRFRNDTERWIVVFAGAGGDGIWITLAGAPTGRRVVSSAGPLEVTGEVPVKRVPDPALTVGQEVVDEQGAPPRSVTVKRVVYGRDDSVLYDETWRTNYRGEKRVVRYGTKKKDEAPPKEEAPPKQSDPPKVEPKPPAREPAPPPTTP